MDITKTKHIHFTGIKGVAMTALALCARDLGIKVTGSDTEEIFVTDETLKNAGISWKIGFGENNLLPKPELVITTGAHGGLKNPEVLAAKSEGINVVTYAEALALFARNKKLISVCGVGGKGSTSSIIATILELSGKKPSFAIGMGNIFPLGRSGKYSAKGDYFICEADEYAISPGTNNNPKFSLLKPYITVVTNIEHDHPDIYPAFKDTERVYKEYFARIPVNGLLIANIDNSNTLKATSDLNVNKITYGTNKTADWMITNIRFKNGKTYFTIKAKSGESFNILLNIPGKFNISNATAAFIVAKSIGLPAQKIIRYLGEYKGARRRFEEMGEKNGVLYYDDYAHHPSEVKESIEAAREWYPDRRIIVIFQPHTFSRTKALLDEFSKAFEGADVIGFMDIYASARESKDDSISSEILADKTGIYRKNVYYTGRHESTLAFINSTVRKGDVVITMGAGDIFHLYNSLKLKD